MKENIIVIKSKGILYDTCLLFVQDTESKYVYHMQGTAIQEIREDIFTR